MAVAMMDPNTDALDGFSDPSIIAHFRSIDMVQDDGAHRQEDMFLECSFPGANTSQSPCLFHDDQLFTRKKTHLGFCFSFHPATYIEKHGGLLSNREGTAGGLHMLVDIQQDEYQVAGRSAGVMVSGQFYQYQY